MNGTFFNRRNLAVGPGNFLDINQPVNSVAWTAQPATSTVAAQVAAMT
jgi:hypothetical protein